MDKLFAIEEGMTALLESVSALSMIMSQAGSSEVVIGSSSKKGKEKVDLTIESTIEPTIDKTTEEVIEMGTATSLKRWRCPSSEETIQICASSKEVLLNS